MIALKVLFMILKVVIILTDLLRLNHFRTFAEYIDRVRLNHQTLKIKVCLVTILKVLKNKTTINIVTVSYSFTQFSTLAKIHTTTAREPSIYVIFLW